MASLHRVSGSRAEEKCLCCGATIPARLQQAKMIEYWPDGSVKAIRFYWLPDRPRKWYERNYDDHNNQL